MKYLNGLELAGFIKERQAKQVRALRQSWKVIPRLAILKTHVDPVSEVYIAKKLEYAKDIFIEVDVYEESLENLPDRIYELNNDKTVHGIVLQLPIIALERTDEIVSQIAPEKDVDGLGPQAIYIPAAVQAIDWLLSGYNINLLGKDIVIVGQGRLVGKPLHALWKRQGLAVRVIDKPSDDFKDLIGKPDVIVSATGSVGLITRDILKPGAIVVDAGTNTEKGRLVGDVASDVYDLDDIIITPKIGGVGPLTVAALMDNVITAARKVANVSGQMDL